MVAQNIYLFVTKKIRRNYIMTDLNIELETGSC